MLRRRNVAVVVAAVSNAEPRHGATARRKGGVSRGGPPSQIERSGAVAEGRQSGAAEAEAALRSPQCTACGSQRNASHTILARGGCLVNCVGAAREERRAAWCREQLRATQEI